LKKLLYLFFCIQIVLWSMPSFVWASSEQDQIVKSKTEKYIQFVYNKIKFPKGGKLKYEAFRNGFYGYLNLRESGKIDRNATLSICDFNLSSNVKRLWVIDVQKKKVLYHSLVSHGSGTGEEYATAFSNIEESHQSSLGFFVTAETYTGNNGYSLKLHGVDGAFNNKAYDRAIVIHGADYVSEDFARANHRSRYEAMVAPHSRWSSPLKLLIELKMISVCSFIITARIISRIRIWLNSSVKQLPAEAELMDLNFPSENLSSAELKEEGTPAAEFADIAHRTVISSKPAKSSEPESSENYRLTPTEPRKVTSIIVIRENVDGTTDTTIVK
jgi:hypothetical protein